MTTNARRRMKLGWSLENLGELVGVSKVTIMRWEKGRIPGSLNDMEKWERELSKGERAAAKKRSRS